MADTERQLNSCLNLIRRMPPSTVENSLAGLIELAPDVADDLFTNVDQPLKVEVDSKAGKSFVVCDYNRDGDSYRSPWTNQYYPPIDGFLPDKRLRAMEELANTLFDAYRNLYFEGGNSSAYFFETDDSKANTFGACWLVHKDVEAEKSLKQGWWDSTHVFEVEPDGAKFVYKLTTTVMISMQLMDDKIGSADLSGLRTQQETRTFEAKGDPEHVCNMGKMLEDMELRIRNAIEGIYIQKTREVINGMRSATNARDKEWAGIAQSLNNAVFHNKK
jgi:capping protein beta